MDQHATTPRYLSTTEVARTLSVSRETVKRWLISGQLPGRNLGGRAGWRVSEEALERFMEERH